MIGGALRRIFTFKSKQ